MAKEKLRTLLSEARRRRVFRLTAFYVVGAWVLVQIALAMFPAFNIPEYAIRFVWIGAVVCLPIALVFAWRYDVRGGKIVKTPVEDSEDPDPLNHGDRATLATLSVIALAISGWLLIQVIELREIPSASQRVIDLQSNSIAVLPFVNMSGDPDNEYFSDGVSEELLNLLSRIPELRIISRSSSFSFKGKGMPVPEIARQLNVSHVVDGSVRKVGNQVRITAQLIEGRTDRQLWSDSFDRELTNIFAIQDEISAAIVTALRGQLAATAGARPTPMYTTNIEAHEAYLRARYLAAQRTETSIRRAIAELEKAVALDPDYALGYSGLANMVLLSSGYMGVAQIDMVARAEPLVAKALELGPELAETQAAAGSLAWENGDLEKALDYYGEAVKINPNYAEVYVWMGMIFEYHLGRYKESFEVRELAVLLDPLSIIALSNYAYGLMYRGRIEEADQVIDQLTSIATETPDHILVFRASLGGNWANLALENLRVVQLDPDWVPNRLEVARAFALLGLEQEARAFRAPIDPHSLSILGKPTEASDVAEELYASNAAPTQKLQLDLGMSLAATGDYASARPLLEALWADHGDSSVTALGSDFIVALMAARDSTSGNEDGEELLGALRRDVARKTEAGINIVNWSMSTEYDAGLLALLEGNTQRALELIGRAVERGSFILPAEAYLQRLYDKPGFAPIRDRQEERQAAERDRFLALVCVENPYADVWQPEEATCEAY